MLILYSVRQAKRLNACVHKHVSMISLSASSLCNYKLPMDQHKHLVRKLTAPFKNVVVQRQSVILYRKVSSMACIYRRQQLRCSEVTRCQNHWLAFFNDKFIYRVFLKFAVTMNCMIYQKRACCIRQKRRSRSLEAAITDRKMRLWVLLQVEIFTFALWSSSSSSVEA